MSRHFRRGAEPVSGRLFFVASLLVLCVFGHSSCSLLFGDKRIYAGEVVRASLKGPKGSFDDPGKALKQPDFRFAARRIPGKAVAGSGFVALGPGGELVLKMAFKSLSGTCRKLTIKSMRRRGPMVSTGQYKVFIGSSPKGPWALVGAAQRSATFNIDGLLKLRGRYVLIRDITPKRTGLKHGATVDSVVMTVRPSDWKDPLTRRTTERPKEARRISRRALKEAERLLESGRLDRALIKARRAVAHNPKEPRALFVLARVHRERKEFFLARTFFDRAFGLGLNRSDGFRMAGETAMKMKGYQQAADYYRRCAGVARKDFICYRKLADLYGILKKSGLRLFYMDQYMIAKARRDVVRGAWPLRVFFSRVFGESKPAIINNPLAFGFGRHLEWLEFMLAQFPKEKDLVLRLSLSLLKRRVLSLTSGFRRRQGAFYRALMLLKAGRKRSAEAAFAKVAAAARHPLLIAYSNIYRAHLLRDRGKLGRSDRLLRKAKRSVKRSPKAASIINRALRQSSRLMQLGITWE